MNKPNLLEAITPCSGRYSLRQDLHLNAWLAVAVVIYSAQLFLLRRFPEWSPLARGFVALAPLPPSLLYLRSWTRFVRGLDELQRRIQLEAFLFASLGTVILGAVLTALAENGVSLGLLQPGLGWGGAFMSLFVLWLVGGAIAKCRYE